MMNFFLVQKRGFLAEFHDVSIFFLLFIIQIKKKSCSCATKIKIQKTNNY